MYKFSFILSAILFAFSAATSSQELYVLSAVGGSGGTEYTDSIPPGIFPGTLADPTSVRLCGGSRIDSVQFFYGSAPGIKHGGNGGICNTYGISSPITKMSGRIEGTKITAIALHSYGGVFAEAGNPLHSHTYGMHNFQYEGTDAKIVGFKSRSGSIVDALGVIATPTGPFSLVSTPAGGSGGTPFFVDASYPSYIQLCGGSKVDSITIGSIKVGGNGGTCSNAYLNSGEKIVEISGRSGNNVAYIQVRTNHGRSLSAGNPTTKNFWFKGNSIFSIHGRSGTLIDSIGVHFSDY